MKRFVKKNRPGGGALASKFVSEGGPVGGKLASSSMPLAPQTATSPKCGEPLARVPDSEAEGVPEEEDDLPTQFKKFDIFDNIDEERIAEFESVFAKTREQSNYDDFKKKQKKADPKKFATCNGVTEKEDGNLVLT